MNLRILVRLCRSGAGLTLIAILGFSAGITAAMATIALPLASRHLPHDPDERLVVLRWQAPKSDTDTDADLPPTLDDWAARTDVFAGVAGYIRKGFMRFHGNRGDVILRTVVATPQFVDILLGSRRACPDMSTCLFVTQAGFAKAFGSDSRFVRSLLVTGEGQTASLESVLPMSFAFPSRGVPVEAILEEPLAATPRAVTSYETVVARLQVGMSLSAAESALRGPDPRARITATGLGEDLSGRVAALARAALAGAAIVLLICAGTSALVLFALGVNRREEFRLRFALGASAGQIARLALMEVATVALAAAVLATGVSAVTLTIATATAPAEYLILGTPTFGWLTGAVAIAGVFVALGVACFAAAAAFCIAWRRRRRAATSLSGRWLRIGVGAVQNAVGIIVLTGAVLMAWSYINLIRQETGFSGRILVIPAAYPLSDTPEATWTTIQASINALSALSCAQASAGVRGSLADNLSIAASVRIEGRRVSASQRFVTHGYLAAAGGRLVQGRWFGPSDLPSTAVIVNRSFAVSTWPNATAVGQSVVLNPLRAPALVVGVVTDELSVALDKPAEHTLYELMSAGDHCVNCEGPQLNYLVASKAGQRCGAAEAERALRGVDGRVVVRDVGLLRDRLMDSIKPRTFAMVVLVLFGLGALAICVVGTIGTMLFITAARSKEAAIRLVVGASRLRIVGVLQGEVMVAVLVGLAVGAPLAHSASVVISHLVYGVPAVNWSGTVLAAFAMFVLQLGMGFIPVRRVIRASLAQTLRDSTSRMS